MKLGKSAKKPNSGAPGVKMLITAASLTATLGGWAFISAKEPQPVMPPAVSTAAAAAPVISIKLAPLPTLVPLAPRSQLVTINQPRAAASVQQPAAQPAAPQAIVLRDVSAPLQNAGPSSSSSAPAPVVNTASSR
jgi:hypothetical protein